LGKRDDGQLERVSIQFTSEQVAWIDRLAERSQSFSRAAAVRSIVQEAINQASQQEALVAA
jgi:metal-responsive CopG/Arc/MetJ family transcriptional regulator